MPSVLFVCTANVCRSPLAAALFKAKLGSAAVDWRVESAGTWAYSGEPAADKVKQVLKEKGIELQEHASRPVNRDLLCSFNLILVMEKGHKEALRAEFPECASRVHLLSEMAGMNHGIQDPIGRSLADFRTTAEELETIMSLGLEKIFRLASENEAK